MLVKRGVPYVLLIFLLASLYMYRLFSPFILIFFIMSVMDSVDYGKGKLDIALRIYVSVNIVLVIVDAFIMQLSGSVVLYASLIITLTALLVLSSIKKEAFE